VEGVLDRDKKLISVLSLSEARKLITSKVASGGMIPKINCCIEAVASGVSTAHIIDGRIEHSVLLEVFTDSGIGTAIGLRKK